MVAIATHGNRRAISGVMRGVLIVAGLLSLAIAAYIGIADGTQGLTIRRFYVGYGAAALGCTAIFLAILGISNVPRPLIYLGRISYGLYVFHRGMLALTQYLLIRFRFSHSSVVRMCVVDVFTLLLCIFVAHLSYRYFEMPFLRRKERFEVIMSRPA